jgi:KTSC domain
MTEKSTERRSHVFTGSSSIAAAVWTSEGELSITFKNGRSYVYENVPEHVFDAFTQAPSAGQYFNQQIKDSFS